MICLLVGIKTSLEITECCGSAALLNILVISDVPSKDLLDVLVDL